MGWFKRDAQRGPYNGVGQWVGEGDAPEMMRLFSVAAACGEAAEAANGVAHSEAGSEAVKGTQSGHVMFAQEPDGYGECGEQAAGKNASGLQSVEAEDFAEILSVRVSGAPVENDVENFCADDSGEDEGDAEVPGVFGFDALLLGIADADPEADENACGDEDAVGRDAEAADLEEAREHLLLDAGRAKFGANRMIG